MKEKKDMEDILGRSSLKENPFGVPKGYFETMQQEVIEKISAIPVMEQEYEEPVSQPVTFFTYLKPAIGLAAVFAIVFGMGYGVMKLTGTSQSESLDLNLQADITPDEIVVENTGTELTEEEVVSIMGNSLEDLFAQENTDSSTEIMQTEINKEEIEQYLIDSRVTTTVLALLE